MYGWHCRSHPSRKSKDAAGVGHPEFEEELPFQFDSATVQGGSGAVGWKEGCTRFFGVLQQEHSSLFSWTGLSFMQSG